MFVFAVYIPRSAELRRERAESDAVQAELASRSARLDGLQELRAEADRARRYLAEFDRAVPVSSEVGRFVEELASLAESRQIRDPQVEPQKPLVGAWGEVLPVQLAFVGTFDAILGYLRSVESMTRIARVTRLNLAQSPDDPGQLSATVTVLIYYQRSARDGASES
jgi:Tfp pilus assembly protein PilO